MNEQALALLADTLPRQQLTQRQIAAYLGFDSPKGHTTKTYDLRTRPLPCRTKEMLLALAALLRGERRWIIPGCAGGQSRQEHIWNRRA